MSTIGTRSTTPARSAALPSAEFLVNTGFALVIVVLVVISLLAGRIWLTPSEVFRALFSSDQELASLIVTDLRMPRTVLALAVGATLGLCGAALQGLTRNPLAEPGLLGVSAGASFGAVIAIYYGLATISTAALPIAGLIGALASMMLTFALGRDGGTLGLVLAGAAVNGFMAAAMSFATSMAPSPQAAYEIMTWLMGSLANRSWDHVWLALPPIVLGCGTLLFTGRALDALSLGEAQAESLGINLPRIRILALVGTAVAVGGATSVTGAIGFIGLVGPHIVRPFVGYQPSRIFLPAALAGAALLLAADIATRLIVFGPEMRLGVFTSFLGTPFFFWLVIRLRKMSP